MATAAVPSRRPDSGGRGWPRHRSWRAPRQRRTRVAQARERTSGPASSRSRRACLERPTWAFEPIFILSKLCFNGEMDLFRQTGLRPGCPGFGAKLPARRGPVLTAARR